MEEDLKILETYLENSAYKQKDSDFFKNGGWEIVDLEIPQALENLIKGYRELEEYYKEQNEVNAKFIPKSKIKEKIKELYEDKDSKHYDMFLEQRDIEKTINILQELLEE